MTKHKILMLPQSTENQVYEFITAHSFELDCDNILISGPAGKKLSFGIKAHSGRIRNSMGGSTIFVNLCRDLSPNELSTLAQCGQLRVQS